LFEVPASRPAFPDEVPLRLDCGTGALRVEERPLPLQPPADPVGQLRSGALFFEIMEAAVDEAYRRSLQPGYFLVAERVFRSEQQPAIVHSRVR